VVAAVRADGVEGRAEHAVAAAGKEAAGRAEGCRCEGTEKVWKAEESVPLPLQAKGQVQSVGSRPGFGTSPSLCGRQAEGRRSLLAKPTL